MFRCDTRSNNQQQPVPSNRATEHWTENPALVESVDIIYLISY